MAKQTQGSAVEKRRHPRTSVQMSLKGIRLDPDGGHVVDALHMMDISRSGMGALAERHFYPGQRLILNLPMTDQSGRRSIYATIRRCGPGEAGYQVGLEFDNASLAASCPAGAALAAA